LKHEKRRDGGSNVMDKRVIERQIRKGKLDASAHKRTLEALPDVSDRVARDADGEPSRSMANAAVSSVSSMRVHPAEPSAAAPDEALGDEDDEEDDDEDDDDEEDGDDEEAAPDAPAST
jgi:hypothetical protein